MKCTIGYKLRKPSLAYLALGKWVVAYFLKDLESFSTFRTLVFIDGHSVPPTKMFLSPSNIMLSPGTVK